MAEPKSETTQENNNINNNNNNNNNNNPFFFLSLIPKFLAKPFEIFNKNNENSKVVENGNSSVKRVDSDEVSGKTGKIPDVVKFPRTKTEVSSIKLESEDVQEDTNPLILWQVYALGGFIILKWAWGKWQERKARGKDDSSGAEQPPPSASDAAPPSAPAED